MILLACTPHPLLVCQAEDVKRKEAAQPAVAAIFSIWGRDHAQSNCTNGLKRYMPSLIRFIFVLALLGGLAGGSLYVLAEYFEPETKEMTTPLRNLKLKRI